MIPPSPPPASTRGALVWLKANLFSSPFNSVLSIGIFAAIAWLIVWVVDWAVFKSVWNAGSIAECYARIAAAHGEGAHGACWAVLRERIGQLLFGNYPPDLYWRPVLAFALFVVALAPVFIPRLPRRMLWFSLIYPIIAFYLIWGFGEAVWGSPAPVLVPNAAGRTFWDWVSSMPQSSLRPVHSFDVGGFLLTFMFAIGGFLLTIPMGIVFELGRRSKLFVIKAIFGSLIELFRGIPLIVLLFAASSILRYALPPGWGVHYFLRLVFVVALVSAVLMSEAIREGISKVSRGQYEASVALGLSRFQTLRFIVIRQVFTFSAPRIALVSAEIFKDTTLLGFAGLLGSLSVVGRIRADADWNGAVWELYGPIAVVFFAICFGLSRYARYLERKTEARMGVS